MHQTRVITSVVGLILLIGLLGWGNRLVFWLVVSTVIVIGLAEFYHLAQARDLPVYHLPGLLAGWLLSLAPIVATSFGEIGQTELTLTLIVLGLFLYALFTGQALSEAISALAITLFGVCYVSWLLSHLIFLHGLPNGKGWVWYLLLVVWAGDTGAYYTGRKFGKHPLSPVISPKKTIEGTLGGLAASLLVSFIAKWAFLAQLRWIDCLLLGLLLATIAQLGDLCESLLKRGADVKDSGTILPGHGGILDRLDGVMFAAPVLYYYVRMVW